MPVTLPGPHQPSPRRSRARARTPFDHPPIRASRRPASASPGSTTFSGLAHTVGQRHGSPPSATCVPTPVAVKNAGMPEPTRIRSRPACPAGSAPPPAPRAGACRANSVLFPPNVGRDRPPDRFCDGSPSPQSSTPVVRHRLQVRRCPPPTTLGSAPTGSCTRQRRAGGMSASSPVAGAHHLVHALDRARWAAGGQRPTTHRSAITHQSGHRDGPCPPSGHPGDVVGYRRRVAGLCRATSRRVDDSAGLSPASARPTAYTGLLALSAAPIRRVGPLGG